jgi:hypothetical protein
VDGITREPQFWPYFPSMLSLFSSPSLTSSCQILLSSPSSLSSLSPYLTLPFRKSRKRSKVISQLLSIYDYYTHPSISCVPPIMPIHIPHSTLCYSMPRYANPISQPSGTKPPTSHAMQYNTTQPNQKETHPFFHSHAPFKCTVSPLPKSSKPALLPPCRGALPRTHALLILSIPFVLARFIVLFLVHPREAVRGLFEREDLARVLF